MAGIGEYHIKKLSRNETVTVDVLCKIMTALNYSIDDIAEFSKDIHR